MPMWKNAGSVILAARTGVKSNVKLATNNCDYQILSMKRHQKSSFMPGTYVFPGGTTEPADADLKWTNLYAHFGFNEQSYQKLFVKTKTRPDILNAGKDELAKEISLRITTIRETFEECGILLCKSENSTDSKLWAKHFNLTESDVKLWQNKVQNDPRSFYEMCQKFECYPDLWSLHEWSNWLTPTTFNNKRFDTIFFFACLDAIPSTNYSVDEAEHLMWECPFKLLENYNLQLPPPQFYELSRIVNFVELDKLIDFAEKRSRLGINLNFPVITTLSDGYVSLLPGDSAYPKNPNKENEQCIDLSQKSILASRNSSPVLNRIEVHLEKNNKKIIACNFKDDFGHLVPKFEVSHFGEKEFVVVSNL